MTPAVIDQTEEGRAFYQQRVALFAKVMTGAQLLGMCGLILQTPFHHLMEPWFAVYQVQTILALGTWLFCRSGSRSVRLVSVAEATMLLGTAVTAAVTSRLLLPGSLSQYIGDLQNVDPVVYGRWVGTVQDLMGITFVVGLSLWVFVRAALVPSRPMRTAVLTELTIVPVALVNALPIIPEAEVEALRAVTPNDLIAQSTVSVVVWWIFITAVCTVVSKVIFGLREQVREARRLGQYTLEAKLGEGGMGTVYRASHAMMRRPTAVKLVRLEEAGETNLARFEREVQQTARLTHPNTVTIFDYGRTPDGVFYYAMELLDGATLEQIVRTDGPQPASRVLKVLWEVASALEEAHGIELIHRDIKPSNIMLCHQGGKADVAKLLDFGLVKELHGEGDPALTAESALAGTPQYMCPESITNPTKVDARSDLYALGAAGYFLLTGTHVFEGNNVIELCSKHLNARPEPPSERLGGPVPEGLEALLLACLEKDPDDRPQSSSEVLRRLARCDEMGAWTEEDARQWWDAHGEELRAALVDVYSETKTIAVDLARQPPA